MNFDAIKASQNAVDPTSNHHCAKTATPCKPRVLRGKIDNFKVSQFSGVGDTTPVLLMKPYQKTNKTRSKPIAKLRGKMQYKCIKNI